MKLPSYFTLNGVLVRIFDSEWEIVDNEWRMEPIYCGLLSTKEFDELWVEFPDEYGLQSFLLDWEPTGGQVEIAN